MECLRCGRAIDEDASYCKYCKHYYENNLNNSVELKKQIKKKLTLQTIICFIMINIICIGFVYFSVSNKDYYTSEDYKKCSIKCESGVKKIRHNKCICSNGNKVNLNE